MRQTASENSLSLQGNLTVDRAAKLKEELERAVISSTRIILDLSSVEDIDLACLQTIYAAAADLSKHGGSFGFRGKLSPRTAKRLSVCGFVRGELERAEGLEDELVGFPRAGA